MKNRESQMKSIGANNSMLFLGGGKKNTNTGAENEIF